jgi:hypothetical protein
LGAPVNYGNPGFPNELAMMILGKITFTNIPKPSDILGAGLL